MSKSSAAAAEEHLNELRTRLAETTEKANKLTSENARLSKQLTLAQKERDQLTEEAAKAKVIKTKSAELLRAVQEENEAIRKSADERVAQALASAQQQHDAAAKILADVQTKIDRFQEDSKKEAESVALVKEENLKLREQLSKFAEATSLEGKHHEAQTKALSLEKQLAEARQKQAEEHTKLVEEQNTKLRELLEKVAKDIDKLKGENGRLRQENATHSRQMKDIMPLITQSNEALREVGKVKEEVTKDRDALAAQLQLEKTKATKLAAVSRTLQNERDDLRARLERTTALLEGVLSTAEGLAALATPAEGSTSASSPSPASASASASGVRGSAEAPGQLPPAVREAVGGDSDNGGQAGAAESSTVETPPADAIDAEELAARAYQKLKSLAPLVASAAALMSKKTST